jgi:hypothetical protein
VIFEVLWFFTRCCWFVTSLCTPQANMTRKIPASAF